MKYLMITNNSKCYERWKEKIMIEYEEEWTYSDVLIRTRNYVHKGYYLLTHPLAGSMKPNQTPFKSIILSKESLEGAEEFKDLMRIESSIESYNKFIRNRPLPDYPQKSVEDFRTLDLSLMEGAMANPIISSR